MSPSALLREARQRAGLSQKELAKRAGTSQPAVARLEAGQASPTLATLERLVGAAGFDLGIELVPKATPDPLVDAYKRDVDRTLLRENLRRSMDERLRSLGELQEFGNELERAVRAQQKRRR
jgi:transcriptional regulator with XRE-family HTH domain